MHYVKSANKQVQKQSGNKRVRLQPYVEGDFVTVKIPPKDSMSSNLPRLEAIVVEVRWKKWISYRLRYHIYIQSFQPLRINVTAGTGQSTEFLKDYITTKRGTICW